MAPTAAAVVVLPTPPEPQVMTISLAAQQLLERVARRPPGVTAISTPARAEGLGQRARWRARRGPG